MPGSVGNYSDAACLNNRFFVLFFSFNLPVKPLPLPVSTHSLRARVTAQGSVEQIALDTETRKN